MKTHKNAAFSLVELSIVLVILGLLVGGILGGQSLIRAAELRKITTEHAEWQTAVNTFRSRFNAMPGDFNRAESFWTAGTGCGTVNQAGACNGDNNRWINPAESSQFWLHLANAGLVNGTFDGTHIHVVKVAGQNYPSSAAGGGWGMLFSADKTGDRTSGIVNAYVFGSLSGSTVNGSLTAEEAWGIDTKLDDGRPIAGLVQTWPMACGADTTSNDAEYNFQASTNCALSFITDGPTAPNTDALYDWLEVLGGYSSLLPPPPPPVYH